MRASKTSPRDIIAFVHIEKAAGTTLIHLLRRHFLFAYCDVRPLSKASGKRFTPRDLQQVLRINPFVRCIGGHAVLPHGPLAEGWPGMRYITLLRDPVSRYVSQFRYTRDKKGRGHSFEDFLANDWYANFQTRKIAGVDDPDAAKRILEERFVAVGTVERFDLFVEALRAILGQGFAARYRRCNVASRTEETDRIRQAYGTEIMDRNRADLELYRFVEASLGKSPEPAALHAEVSETPSVLSAAALAFRKLYVEPRIGLRRSLNGLSWSGSY